jgi:hypothetical protein
LKFSPVTTGLPDRFSISLRLLPATAPPSRASFFSGSNAVGYGEFQLYDFIVQLGITFLGKLSLEITPVAFGNTTAGEYFHNVNYCEPPSTFMDDFSNMFSFKKCYPYQLSFCHEIYSLKQ